MRRLVALTSEQERELRVCCERWRTLALTTDPIEPAAARQAVRRLYLAAGGLEPKAIVVLASPMACLMARGLLKLLLNPASRDSVPQQRYPEHLCEPLGESFCAEVWHSLYPQLRNLLGTRPWEYLGEELGEQLGAPGCSDRGWKSLREELREEVDGLAQQFCNLGLGFRSRFADAIWPQLGSGPCFKIEEGIREPLRQVSQQLCRHVADEIDERLCGKLDHVTEFEEFDRQIKVFELYQRNHFSGGHEGYWIAPYEFAASIGLRFDGRARRHFHIHRDCAHTCGWIYPYRAIAFVSDRPGEIHFDEHNRLHHATGMALRYRDGFGIHGWHGTRIPGWLIDNRDGVTPQAIEELGVDEVRLAAVQIYGFDRYLTQSIPTLVASDEVHGELRRLLEWPLSLGGRPVRMIEVMNGSLEPDGSRRKFRLHALSGKTPAEVIAASYGIAPAHYREAVRT
jgi:hypothetical protein